MGSFSEEALTKFNQLCSSSVNFAEGETYDFVRCIMPDGEVYGTTTQCKQGKPLPEGGKAKEKEKKPPASAKKKLAKLTKMFRLKTGRDMSTPQLIAAANKIGVPIPQGKTAEEYLKELIPSGEKVMPVKSA